MSRLGEMRSLTAEALKIANDFEYVAPPELHAGVEIIGDLLDSATECRGGDEGAALAGAGRAGLSTYLQVT